MLLFWGALCEASMCFPGALRPSASLPARAAWESGRARGCSAPRGVSPVGRLEPTVKSKHSSQAVPLFSQRE